MGGAVVDGDVSDVQYPVLLHAPQELLRRKYVRLLLAKDWLEKWRTEFDFHVEMVLEEEILHQSKKWYIRVVTAYICLL